MSGNRSFKWLAGVLIAILLFSLVKAFLLDYYLVSSSSMLPALHTGDHIIIARNVCIRKGDIAVFNKPIWGHQQDDPRFLGPEYVKRCYGVPGDTVSIDHPALNTGEASRVKEHYSIYIYPQDTSFKWEINKMGPLWIPKKGTSIVLNDRNIRLYRTIMQFEGYSQSTQVTASKDPKRIGASSIYTFKYDYYFFVGDNFYESEDSRYWGFVPLGNIHGRVICRI